MRGQAWALGLAALALLAGADALPRSREMESLKLVDTLAVDRTEEGVRLTALTAVRAAEDEESEALTGTGESLTAAWGDLRESSSRRAYLGQAEQLLIGEGQDLSPVFELALRHRELRLDTSLYIVQGAAGPGLERSAGRTSGETGGEDPRRRTVGEVLPRLAEGEYALAPALAEDERGELSPAGWAVLGPEGVAGYLEGDAAQGAELLSGGGEGRAVTLAGGGVELTGVKVRAGSGAVCCTLTARAVQGAPTEAELAAWGEEQLRAALEPGWDCWGLDRQLSALRPWAWSAWRGTDIRELDVKVTGRLVEG